MGLCLDGWVYFGNFGFCGWVCLVPVVLWGWKTFVFDVVLGRTGTGGFGGWFVCFGSG